MGNMLYKYFIPVLFLLCFARIFARPPTQHLVDKLLCPSGAHVLVRSLFPTRCETIIVCSSSTTSYLRHSVFCRYHSDVNGSSNYLYLLSSWRPSLLSTSILESARFPNTKRQRLTTTLSNETICQNDQLHPPCIPANARLTLPSHLPTQGCLMMMSFSS